MKNVLLVLLALMTLSEVVASSRSGNFDANKKAIKEMLNEMAQDSKKDVGKPMDSITVQLGTRIEENKYIQSYKMHASKDAFVNALPLLKEKGIGFLCNHIFWGEVIRIYDYEVVYDYVGSSEKEEIGSYSVVAADCSQLDRKLSDKVVDGCAKAVISFNRGTKELAVLGKTTILNTAKQCEVFVPNIFLKLKQFERRTMLKDPNKFGCSIGVKFMLTILLGKHKAKLEEIKNDDAKMESLITRFCY